MRSLYLRIYLTVVAALALFALVSGALLQRHFEDQRVQVEGAVRERIEAWGDLLERSLPGAAAPVAEQSAALREWSQRLRLPMALDDAAGQRIATSESYLRRELDSDRGPAPPRLPGSAGANASTSPAVDTPGAPPPRVHAIRFEDGRTLWVPRFGGGNRLGPGGPGAGPRGRGDPRDLRDMRDVRPQWLGPRTWPDGVGVVLLLVVLFIAVAAGAYPVVRRLTRRLEALKQGVEAFGAGALHQRVAEDGKDEVAAVGASFNRAATRIEALLRAHQSLLANASHELRSPLARLKMAMAMLEDAPPAQREALKREIHTDIGELDALVEEVLLASRLDAAAGLALRDSVALLPLAAEEAARTGAVAQGDDVQVPGDERLLRRAVRNLLENAQRYGGGAVEVDVVRIGASVPGDAGTTAATAALPAPASPALPQVEVRVCDRGPGVPEALRERIFEAFFRLPGHAERAGGVGLGLSLVRQIAERHGGQVRCEGRDGGGSCFVLRLPAAAGR